MARAIGFGSMATVVALLTGMSRINEDHGHTSECSLVRNILPQLKEPPICVSWPLWASGLNPLPYACQVFQSNGCSGALRRVHETLGNTVIGILLKPGLSTFELVQFAACGSGPMLLQFVTSLRKTLAFLFHLRATVDCAIGVHRQIDDPEINTQDALNSHLVRFKDIAHDRNVEHAFDVHQIDFALAKGQQGTLPLATLIRDGQPARHSPDREVGIRAEAKNPVIIGLGRIAFKAPSGCAIQFIGISNFGNTAYRHLRCQAKLCPTALVGQFVQGKLAKGLRVPRLARQPIACTIRRLERLKERCVLGFGRSEFEIGHQFHGLKYGTSVVQEQL